MIRRVYIDNFRTLVNFEWKPGRLALLLGDNGTGKTSVPDALWRLKALVADESLAAKQFSDGQLTAWDSRREQRFEIDVEIDGRAYAYGLTVHHPSEPGAGATVGAESLTVDGVVVLQARDGQVQLFDEAGRASFDGPLATSRSALAVLRGRAHAAIFKEWLADAFQVFAPEPYGMSSSTVGVDQSLNPNLENFAPWYPRWSTEEPEAALSAMSALSEALPGFRGLRKERHRARLLARMEHQGRDYELPFDELSSGQMLLCALYAVLQAFAIPGRTVVFDEPENYLALREIQPWLLEVVDRALGDDGPQVWFISHHPELLNQLAPSHGVRFFRETGPTRIELFATDEHLLPSEVVARGWDGG